MVIGIDCRMWVETGIGTYTQNIVKELSKIDSNNTYLLFVLSKDYSAINLPSNFKKIKTDIYWYSFSEQLLLPIIYYKHRLDVLFAPHINVPILYFGKIYSTIHDLTLLKYKTGKTYYLPDFLYQIRRLAFLVNVAFTSFKAKKIFTVSTFVKNEIINILRVKESKVLITPNAVSPDFVCNTNSEDVLKKYKINKPYILYVGNAHPHKNIPRLIEAFNLVNQNLRSYNFVIAGKLTDFHKKLEVNTHIVLTDFIETTDLPCLYENASVFVNPSMYEGFGIQLLEAFKTKTTVACSNTTSLPEVGKDACFYFDPYDVKDMAQTIYTAITTTDKTKEALGQEVLKNYSWDKTAKLIHDRLVDINE